MIVDSSRFKARGFRVRQLAASWCVVAAVAGLTTSVSHAQTRDPWLQPFSSESIWNMPLGQSASYIASGVGAANYVGFDTEYFVKPTTADPIRDLYQAGSWGNRSSGTLFLNRWRLPDSFVLADANATEQPNNCTSFFDVDGRTVRQLNAAARPTAGGNIWGYWYLSQNVYKKGLYGSHAGAGLSGIGGSIRSGELTGSGEIKHALKLTMNEKYLSYVGATPGYRWPAYQTDSGASSIYKGTVPQMTMGSLVAIASSKTETSLGLETAAGQKVFRALRDYGAYIVDTAGWDAIYLDTEQGVRGQLQSQLGYDPESSNDSAWKRDINRLMTNLSVIDDNSATNVGGAGTRRVAKADPLPAMPAPAGAFSRAGWTVSGTIQNMNSAIDGSVTTSASTSGNQTSGGDWICLDMGASKSFNRILLETAMGDENNFPRNYTIYTSDSGSWGNFLTSATGDIRNEGESEILLANLTTARYITIQQSGAASTPWSIAEVNVFNNLGVTAATPTPTPTATPTPTPTATPTPTPSTTFNGSFETPTTSGYTYNATGGPWAFASNSGVQRNGSAWGAPTAPEGVQTAFLQGINGTNGTISQSTTFNSGSYTLSFQVAKRGNFGGGQSFDVFYDTTKIGSYTPTATSFALVTTSAFTATAGSHTVKFVGTSTSGDNTVFLDDVKLVASAVSTLLSQGKTAVTSSTESTTSTADKAFDGNSSTRWASASSDPQWIYVDLGSNKTVTQIKLNWETACGKDYVLQSAADGATNLSTDTPWTTIQTVTGNTASGVLTYNVSGSGRYVRMKSTSRATQWGNSLWEMQVFGY